MTRSLVLQLTVSLTSWVLLMLGGCGPNGKGGQGPGGGQPFQAVGIEVVAAKEQLGHNITEGQVHTVWVDAVRGRIVGTDDPFVIYAVNSPLEKAPFRFEQGKHYTVTFTGDIQKGVMGFQGKCIDIAQVVRVVGRGPG